MEHWIYNNKSIVCLDDIDNNKGLVGFVYKITHIPTGKFYIGKKSVEFNRKKKITKAEKEATGTRRKTKRVASESDWKTYYGSSKELLAEIKVNGVKQYKREIIELCYTKKYLNFCEIKHQILNDVLVRNSYNGNILGKYFRKDMINTN